MKKKIQVLAALLLVLCITLTGCNGLDFAGYFSQMFSMLVGGFTTPFEQMEYTRPDIETLETVVDDCCQRASQAGDLDQLIRIIQEAYVPLDQFSTAYALANIHYCKDLTDFYWKTEYDFCTKNAAIVQASLDRFYRVLAQSAFREQLETDIYFGTDFFDDYEGESFYDEAFTQLLTREATLESQYYALYSEYTAAGTDSEEGYNAYAAQAAQLFVELVALRQEMAEYLGYESYPEFAYDYYYDRDYTCEETVAYLADIRAELVPLYRDLVTTGLDVELEYSDEEATLAYVQEMAYAMGGTIADAYDEMVYNGLYDISYGANKYNASFEVYISSYYSPYIFLNPTLSEYDKLTFAHEFGHFCCDFASYGSAAGVDVAEVFSQGMEYLSLSYVQNTQVLEQVKMASSLSVFVEQAAFASFEQQVYGLTGDALTVENVQALYEQVGMAYGFDSWEFDARDYVSITHFFTSPMYVISYVVSNDLAMQLYQMEKTQRGSGLRCLEANLTTMQSGIVAFAAEAGLTSPFADGRITSIKETLRQVLK